MTPTGTPGLSRFTPSLMSHELLERLFVAREHTLGAILARVDGAASGPERNHTLLVGPRGAGKTHLVSLAYHRIAERRRAGAALQVAWLPEDPWTIVSYRHLLAAITERLEPELDEPAPRSAAQLESVLNSAAAAGGPIVVLVENLDRILAAIGDEGQQRLRHLLQAERSLLLIATSTRLDRALSDQARPFYGFFTTTRLEPFDVDEAAAMLAAIARERDDDDLVAYLQGKEGRARLRTITHLAGGQPRMWATLASALTVGGLDELVDLLLTRFDDLTPYYQEQLGRLSGQQRLVVAELAQGDRPIHVRELAELLEIEQRSLAKTMSELVDRGWATPTTSRATALLDGRRTYYELAEPLARLSFQIKESRGEPLRLIVDFLKHWFDPADLDAVASHGLAAEYMLLAADGHANDAVIAVTRRLHRLPITRARAVDLLAEADAALAALGEGDPDAFLCLPTPVRAALEDRLDGGELFDLRRELHWAAAAEFGSTRHPAMAGWIERVQEMVVAGSPRVSEAQLLLADWLGRAWRFDDAEEVLAAVAASVSGEHREMLTAHANLATAYWSAGRTADAITLEERVLNERERILGPEHPDTLSTRANLATSYLSAGRNTDAITLNELVLHDRERILGPEHLTTLTTRGNLAACYWSGGRIGDAITLNEHVLEDHERILGPEHPDTLWTRANLAHSYWSAGRTANAITTSRHVLADHERILGPEHPNTLTTRANLASYYWSAGLTADAALLNEQVLAERERILGPEHPDTLMTCAELANAYQSAGRTVDAIALMERVVEACERVLGPEHPRVADYQARLADMTAPG